MSFRRDLEQHDVYDALQTYKSENLGERIENEWKAEKKKKYPNLFNVLFRMFGYEYLIIGLNQLVIKSILV